MNICNITSSYTQNNLGETLFEAVIKHQPFKIIEFGTLNGYSAIHMGLALKQLGRGLLFTYDLYDKYQYNHGEISEVSKRIEEFELEDYVVPARLDINNWFTCGDTFDMCHIDISNDGNTVETFIKTAKLANAGSVCLFEGGSEARDKIDWMIKYDKLPINPVIKQYGGKILNDKFPSISEIIL